jgi:hypothetical protein
MCLLVEVVGLLVVQRWRGQPLKCRTGVLASPLSLASDSHFAVLEHISKHY